MGVLMVSMTKLFVYIMLKRRDEYEGSLAYWTKSLNHLDKLIFLLWTFTLELFQLFKDEKSIVETDRVLIVFIAISLLK